jgi:N-methylhydantoinase B
MAVVPVEVWETLTHTTVESKRLTTDSGGAGRWRGGLGQEVTLRNDTGQPLVMLGMGNRTEFPARGLFGGQDGTLRIHAVDGKPVHAKGRIEVKPGARITVTEAGGAGFGDPKARERDAVAADVAEGFVSREAAQQIYGWRG